MKNNPLAIILSFVALTLALAGFISDRNKEKAVQEATPVFAPVESVKVVTLDDARMRWLDKEVIPKKTTIQVQYAHCIDVITPQMPYKESVDLCDLRRKSALEAILPMEAWLIKQEIK